MKDNKPILFINSAQTDDVSDHSQYVYDSRFDKFEKKPVIHKESIEPKVLEETENITLENFVKEEIIENKEFEVQANVQKNNKLYNKLELLNKRAKLGRYVFVSIQIKEDEIEGYFKQLLEKEIIVTVADKDETILISDIDEIIILKV